MEIYKKSGTKERLFEMMERVNKLPLEKKIITESEKLPSHIPSDAIEYNGFYIYKSTDPWRIKYGEHFEYVNKNYDASLDGESWSDNGFGGCATFEECKDVIDELNADNGSFNEAINSDVEFENDEDTSGDTPVTELPHDENHPLAGVMDLENGEDQLNGDFEDNSEQTSFDPEQLALGLKIEMEQTNDPKTALEIAMSHLTETPDYYSKGSGEENADDMSTLLDPSTHWIDDYTPKNVEEGNIDYPQGPDDAEALEDRHREEQDFYQQASKDDDMTHLEKEEGL